MAIVNARYSKALNPSGMTRDSLDPVARAESERVQREKYGSAWRNNASAQGRYAEGGAWHNDAYGASDEYVEREDRTNVTRPAVSKRDGKKQQSAARYAKMAAKGGK